MNPLYLSCHCLSIFCFYQILKKGQRDCGQAIRDAVQRLRTAVENDVDTAFRHFSSSILLKETGMCHVRQEYLQMSYIDVFNAFFSKLKTLYRIVTDHEQAWDCVSMKFSGTVKSKRRELNKTQMTINEFKTLLNKDVLFQKLMHVSLYKVLSGIIQEKYLQRFD